MNKGRVLSVFLAVIGLFTVITILLFYFVGFNFNPSSDKYLFDKNNRNSLYAFKELMNFTGTEIKNKRAPKLNNQNSYIFYTKGNKEFYDNYLKFLRCDRTTEEYKSSKVKQTAIFILTPYKEIVYKDVDENEQIDDNDENIFKNNNDFLFFQIKSLFLNDDNKKIKISTFFDEEKNEVLNNKDLKHTAFKNFSEDFKPLVSIENSPIFLKQETDEYNIYFLPFNNLSNSKIKEFKDDKNYTIPFTIDYISKKTPDTIYLYNGKPFIEKGLTPKDAFFSLFQKPVVYLTIQLLFFMVVFFFYSIFYFGRQKSFYNERRKSVRHHILALGHVLNKSKAIKEADDIQRKYYTLKRKNYSLFEQDNKENKISETDIVKKIIYIENKPKGRENGKK